MYLVAGVATFTVLFYCIGTTAADCSYLLKHYDNKTATYREDIRYRDCRRTEECCGNYTERRCCLLKSQENTSPKSEGSQHAPALLLAGITTALVVIGVIAIFCWRLVCISAYKEASGARGPNVRHRRGQTSCSQDNNANTLHQERSHGQQQGSHRHGHHLGVTSLSLQFTLPVIIPDEHLVGPQPPTYTKDIPVPATKYIAPPSYEDSVNYKECDPPPAYTLSITDDRLDTCPSHIQVDMHLDDGLSRGQAN